MLNLALAMLAFLGSHYALSHPAIRPRAVAALGAQGFLIVYSVVALTTLVAAIWAYRQAPFVPLWDLGHARFWIAMVAMIAASVLFVGGLTQNNPASLMGSLEPEAEDPAPGILKVTRHPVMWSFGLWAFAHLAANGHLAALILFGGIAAEALLGTRRIDAKRRLRDPETYARFMAATSNLPLAAILAGRQRLGTALAEIGTLRIGAGLLLYALLVFAHPWLAGRGIGAG
jgi:uncharacterized membrane protein